METTVTLGEPDDITVSLDRFGRFTVPVHVRRIMKWQEDELLHIYLDFETKVVSIRAIKSEQA